MDPFERKIVRPEVIPSKHFYFLKNEINNYPATHRYVILGIKEYPVRTINVLAGIENPNDRIIIFCMRFLHIQMYQPLLAILYSRLSSYEYVTSCVQLYWVDLIRDLISLKLKVFATISSAHPIFKTVIESMSEYNFEENGGEAIVYTPIHSIKLLHLFDINSLCHHLETYLFYSNELVYFLEVDIYEKSSRWHKMCGTEIQAYCDVSDCPKFQHISNEPVAILNTDFFFEILYSLLIDEASFTGINSTNSTNTFLALCCPYNEFMNSLSLIKVNDLLNLTNSFRPLKMLLSTAFLVKATGENNKFYRRMTEAEEIFHNVLYNSFQSIYLYSVRIDPRAVNVEPWCDILLNTFNSFRTNSLIKQYGKAIYDRIEKLKNFNCLFNTKLSHNEYIKLDGLNHFKNVAYVAEDNRNNNSTSDKYNQFKDKRSVYHSSLEISKRELRSKMMIDQNKIDSTEQYNLASNYIFKVPTQQKTPPGKIKSSRKQRFSNMFRQRVANVRKVVKSKKKPLNISNGNTKRKTGIREAVETKNENLIKKVNSLDIENKENSDPTELDKLKAIDGKETYPTVKLHTIKNSSKEYNQKELFPLGQLERVLPCWKSETAEDFNMIIKDAECLVQRVEKQPSKSETSNKHAKGSKTPKDYIERIRQLRMCFEKAIEAETNSNEENISTELGSRELFEIETKIEKLMKTEDDSAQLKDVPFSNIVDNTEASIASNRIKPQLQCICNAPSTSMKICPLFELEPNKIEAASACNFETYTDPANINHNNLNDNSKKTSDNISSDYCTSEQFLKQLYNIYLELPIEKSRLWLFQAWLATINSFRTMHENLLNSDIKYLHAYCFNLSHIDHYVNECNIKYQDFLPWDSSLYPHSREEYRVFYSYYKLTDILEENLIRIAADM